MLPIYFVGGLRGNIFGFLQAIVQLKLECLNAIHSGVKADRQSRSVSDEDLDEMRRGKPRSADPVVGLSVLAEWTAGLVAQDEVSGREFDEATAQQIEKLGRLLVHIRNEDRKAIAAGLLDLKLDLEGLSDLQHELSALERSTSYAALHEVEIQFLDVLIRTVAIQ